MHYFINNPNLALAFKNQIQGDIEFIKANRPDIIESWQYHQEFLKICKEYK